jgi:hypothetical protein
MIISRRLFSKTLLLYTYFFRIKLYVSAANQDFIILRKSYSPNRPINSALCGEKSGFWDFSKTTNFTKTAFKEKGENPCYYLVVQKC